MFFIEQLHSRKLERIRDNSLNIMLSYFASVFERRRHWREGKVRWHLLPRYLYCNFALQYRHCINLVT
jgi:hypothetical protein